jgi:hypothetical protein
VVTLQLTHLTSNKAITFPQLYWNVRSLDRTNSEQTRLMFSSSNYLNTFSSFSVGATVHDEPRPLFLLYIFWIIWTVGRTPSARDQPAARLLPTQDNTNIHSSSGIPTNDPSVWAGEDSSWLRRCGHCDRQITLNKTKILPLVSCETYMWNLFSLSEIEWLGWKP